MKEEEFDKMFDEYYDQATKQVKGVPDNSHSWELVKKMTDRRKMRRQRIKRLNIAAVIILSMCVGAVLSNSPQVAKAISIIVQQIKKLEDGSISFLFGSTSNPVRQGETVAPDLHIEEVERNAVRLEEIKKLEGVQLPNLAFLSEDFTVSHVWLYYNKATNRKDKLRIQMSEVGSEKRINLHFSLLGDGEVLISGGNEGTTEEKLKRGSIGYLSPAGEGRHAIEFLVNSIHVMIIGELSKDDIIELSNKIIVSD